MDNTQLIGLIILALIILAVIIAFRKRIALTLNGWGIGLNIEAENEPATPTVAETPAAPLGPAGVQLHDAESTEGGLLIEEGSSETGPGIDVKGAKTKDDIVIGKGRSGGSPKDNPPA